jgi:hypothetical protein
MKTHSWPHPVLATKALCDNEFERDYQSSIDFVFVLTKVTKNEFNAKIQIDSGAIRAALIAGKVDAVIYQEAVESPLRSTRRLSPEGWGAGGTINVPVQLDQSKFSGGLKVCVYLVAKGPFLLETSDCVDGYDMTLPVAKGALLGYSNACMLYDDKSNISNIFKVRRQEGIEYMSVNSDADFIMISLPAEMFDKYGLYRKKNLNVTSCAFLFPALVETIGQLNESIDGNQELEQWPDGFFGARLAIVQSLAKAGVSPRDVSMKGAVHASSVLFSQFKENHSKLFTELNTSYAE